MLSITEHAFKNRKLLVFVLIYMYNIYSYLFLCCRQSLFTEYAAIHFNNLLFHIWLLDRYNISNAYYFMTSSDMFNIFRDHRHIMIYLTYSMMTDIFTIFEIYCLMTSLQNCEAFLNIHHYFNSSSIHSRSRSEARIT